MVAALFRVQILSFPWEIPLFSIDFWNVQWAISPLVPWRLVAHFVRTGLIWLNTSKWGWCRQGAKLCFLLSVCFTWIRNHFDTKIILIPLYIPKIWGKTKLILYRISIIQKSMFLKQLKVSFCKRVNETNKQTIYHVNKLSWPCCVTTKL